MQLVSGRGLNNSMWPYAIRRILGAIPTIFIIVTLTFFMMRIAPGGPFDAQRHLPPEIEHNIRAAYNLDKPLYEQYGIYLGRLAHGDLGPSFKNHDFTVTELIADGLPVSAKLGFSAIVLAILLGIYIFLPAGGWNGGAFANMILPVIVLALPQIAVIARLVRGSMVEVLRSNYVR